MTEQRYVIEVTEAARDRINELAGVLTSQGPGRYGQKETVSYLIKVHDLNAEALAGALEKMASGGD